MLDGMRGPNYRSFSFSIIPSKEHPGLIDINTYLTPNTSEPLRVRAGYWHLKKNLLAG